MNTAPLLFYVPQPIGWLALTPDALHEAQKLAEEVLGSDTNTSQPATSSIEPVALLTAEAAAVVLSVDAQCLLRQAREGRIPHTRIGRYVRFDPAVIAAYCSRPPRPPAAATGATPPGNVGRAGARPGPSETAIGGRAGKRELACPYAISGWLEVLPPCKTGSKTSRRCS